MRSAAALLALLATVPAAASGAHASDWEPGERLTMIHCGRCHVIGERNRMGGIGSTPSFMVIRTWDDWEDRAEAFWTLNPHPAFTQIDGITDPFPADRPSPIHPIALTQDEVDEIVAYMRTLEPAELGAQIGSR